jgi:competence/damage-inducible protein CinA-like protein
MEAIIVTVGDEILIGQIIDTNSSWMAKRLSLQGINVQEMLSVSDTHEAITESLKYAFAKVDLVLMTGGLGPTKDDITKKAIADFYGVEMKFHQPTFDYIQKLFKRWGRSTTEAHRLQCFMPVNATLIENKMGSAPGMWFDENDQVLVSMAGVPYEMEYIMTNGVLSRLKNRFLSIPIVHRTVLTVGEGESRLALKIEDFENSLPPNIKLAYLPGLGQVRLRLTGRGKDEAVLKKLIDEKVDNLKKIIPEFIFGYEKDTLESVVGELLKEHKKTLSTAESCTGGYIAHRITSIAGSSDYFMGSIVSYSNEMKMNLLNVKPETLEKHGAVSEATVIEMVKGALKTMETDIAVSVSGIAGPGGGTREKPVGTIWLAVGDQNKIETQKLLLGKNRLKNIEYTAVQALNMIRKFLLEQ